MWLSLLQDGRAPIVGIYKSVPRALNACRRMLMARDGEIFVHRCAGADLADGNNLVGYVVSAGGNVKTHEL